MAGHMNNSKQPQHVISLWHVLLFSAAYVIPDVAIMSWEINWFQKHTLFAIRRKIFKGALCSFQEGSSLTEFKQAR